MLDRIRGAQGRSWWMDVALLLVVVGGIHLSRLDVLPLRGEESRWARVATEMVESGDWIVPRQQGQPFLSRPPLGNWLIAISGSLRGDFLPRSVRLPSALATLSLCMLLYVYGRRCAGSRITGVASALAYASMGHVLQLGQLAESEAVFTALVAGSLLSWHLLVRSGRPDWMAWGVGYGLAALATLTKGPQAPVYFAGGTALYLLGRRDLRRLVSWSHGLGLLAYAGILLSWQIPFALRAGLPAVREIWSGDTLLRFQDATVGGWIVHLIVYPLDLLTCMAPWSLFLVSYAYGEFRRSLGASRDVVVFTLCAIGLAFLSCWLVPNSRGRYFMPLYPLVAVLIGVAIDGSIRAVHTSSVRLHWRRFARLGAIGCVIAVLVVAVLQGLPQEMFRSYREPAGPLIVYAVLACVASAVLWRSARRPSPRWGVAGLVALAGFLGLTGTLLGIDINLRASESTVAAVASVRRSIPDDARLVSFGYVHHLFAYYYRQPIEFRTWERGRHDDQDLEYFCYEVVTDSPRTPRFPFAWEQIGTVSNERYHRDDPRFYTVVGRRLPAPAPAVATQDEDDGARR